MRAADTSSPSAPARSELLPDDELHGVLAHELGHHLGLHTVALTITHWLSLPIITLARDRLPARAAGLRRRGRPGPAIGRAGADRAHRQRRCCSCWPWPFLATVLVARRIGDRLGRSAEFAADQRAVDMGYGRHLALALRRVHALDRQDGRWTAARHRQPPLADAPLGPHRGPAAHRTGLTRQRRARGRAQPASSSRTREVGRPMMARSPFTMSGRCISALCSSSRSMTGPASV